jgi:lysophospholipase L1-like esterase
MIRVIIALVVSMAVVLVIPSSSSATPIVTMLKIATMGDSLTYGYGSSADGYRTELGQRLAAVGVTPTWVGPTHGYNGGTVQSMITGMDNGWATELTTADPDVIILGVGTHNAAGDPPGMTGFQTAYQTLLTKLHAAATRAKILTARLTYSSISWSPNEVTVNMYVILTNWASPWATYTYQVAWDVIPPCGYLYNAAGDSGVHPRDAGYGWMAREAYRTLQLLYTLPDIPTDAYTDPITRRPGIERAVIGC